MARGVSTSRNPSLPSTSEAVAGLSRGELVELVTVLVGRGDALEAENQRLRAVSAKNSGISSKPTSRDPAAERSRQGVARRARRSRDGEVRRPGNQPGGEGMTLAMVEDPDEIVVHANSFIDSATAS